MTAVSVRTSQIFAARGASKLRRTTALGAFGLVAVCGGAVGCATDDSTSAEPRTITVVQTVERTVAAPAPKTTVAAAETTIEAAAAETEQEAAAIEPLTTTVRQTVARTSAPPVVLETTTKTAPARSGSISQDNARSAGANYLEISAFSRSGLIDQLEYEGFSTAEATAAVDSLNPDWNEQAAKAADEFLAVSPFSRSSLIDQLVYGGFTESQAEYGASTTGL